MLFFNHAHKIDEGGVHFAVHVYILWGEVLNLDDVLSRKEFHLHHVAESGVEPFSLSALRHDERALRMGVDDERADGALIVGVDGSAAVGISHVDEIGAGRFHDEGDGDVGVT